MLDANAGAEAQPEEGGLTVRGWLAAMAMQGLLANDAAQHALAKYDPRNAHSRIATASVKFSEALVAELNKPKESP